MPRHEHFGLTLELLALPRQAAAPRTGGFCRLARGGQHSTEMEGPLDVADFAYCLEDTGHGNRPYKASVLWPMHGRGCSSSMQLPWGATG
jgi:hypothetical protein